MGNLHSSDYGHLDEIRKLIDVVGDQYDRMMDGRHGATNPVRQDALTKAIAALDKIQQKVDYLDAVAGRVQSKIDADLKMYKTLLDKRH